MRYMVSHILKPRIPFAFEVLRCLAAGGIYNKTNYPAAGGIYNKTNYPAAGGIYQKHLVFLVSLVILV